MSEHDPFKTWGDNLWDKLDDIDRGDWWRDSPEEEQAFTERVAQEIQDRYDEVRTSRTPLAGPSVVVQSRSSPLFSPAGIDRTPSLPMQPHPASAPTSMPRQSARASSRISHPSGLPPHLIPSSRSSMSTPVKQTDTFVMGPAPLVETPTMPPPLPAPPQVATIGPTFNTPINIPTPTQTPSNMSVGRAKRDDPATPAPLGNEAFAKLRGKKEFQNLTKLFETFAQSAQLEGVSGSGSRGTARGTGRAPILRTTSRTSSTGGLGGNILKGLRFCLPPQGNRTAMHKQRGEIIVKLGGTAVIQPDTAITHVIYDSGRSAALLARDLGVSSLSELPEGTVCVKWEWVANCKLAGRLLPTDQFLSFQPTNLTRAISTAGPQLTRMADITQDLRGSNGPLRRRRDHTASDSDTESSQSQRRSRRVLARNPVPPTAPAKRVLNSKASGNVSNGANATRHSVTPGPGWIEAQHGEEDGLDEMIMGVKSGIVEDEVSDNGSDKSDEQAQNGNPLADRFKCGQKHDGSDKGGPNEWLACEFDKLHDLYVGVQGKNDFAIRGYQRAAGILRRTQYPITSGAQAAKIKGIGANLSERFLTGAQGRAYYENTERARTIAIFKDIYGVGKNVANILYQRGARSIEDLKSKDYGLTEGQKIGLELYEDLCSRIPREECRQLFEKIRDAALTIEPKLWIEIMGSYRRGAESSGDVDILFTKDTSDGTTHGGVLRRLVHTLRNQGIITHDLSTPHAWDELEAKWMGVGRVSVDSKYRRIDILCIPYEQWGAALIYFTGNEVFNRSIRLFARKKGYSLNQRGLFQGVMRDRKGLKTTEGELIASRTEQEIFDVLGIRWRAPHHRRP